MSRFKAIRARLSMEKRPVLKRVVKNTFALTAANVFYKLVSFLVIIPLARELGPYYFGRYSTIINWVGMFTILASLGMEQVVIREASRNRERLGEYVNKLFPFKLLLAVICYGAAVALFALTGNELNYTLLLFIFALSMSLISVSEVFRYVFNVTQRLDTYALTVVIDRIVFIAAVLGFGQMFGGIKALIAAWLLSSLAALVSIYYFSSRKVKFTPTLQIDWKFVGKIVGPAKWFAAAAVLASLYNQANVVMASVLVSPEQAGLYSAAQGIFLIALYPLAAVQTALFPVTSQNTNKKFLFKLGKGILAIAALSAVAAAVMGFFGPQLIDLIYGEKYSAAAGVLSLLAWLLPISIAAIWGAQVLDSTNNQKLHVANGALMAGTNIALNFMLIPAMGAAGAAAATLTAQTLGLALLSWWAYGIASKLPR